MTYDQSKSKTLTQLTFTALSKVRSYCRSNDLLISPKSISDRETMIRINVESSVPIPFMARYKQVAKKSAAD